MSKRIVGNPLAFGGRHLEALGRLWQARIEMAIRNWSDVIDGAKRREESVLSEETKGDEATVRLVEESIRRVDRLVPGTTCIHRSLAGQRMLVRRALGARLVIGLRKGEEAIEGHAWLEVRRGDCVWRAFSGQESGYSVIGA